MTKKKKLVDLLGFSRETSILFNDGPDERIRKAIDSLLKKWENKELLDRQVPNIRIPEYVCGRYSGYKFRSMKNVRFQKAIESFRSSYGIGREIVSAKVTSARRGVSKQAVHWEIRFIKSMIEDHRYDLYHECLDVSE